MKRWLVLGAGVSLSVAAGVFWVVTEPKPAFTEANAALLEQPGDAEKGRLAFAAGDCSSCHASPGQSDPLRLGGGLDQHQERRGGCCESGYRSLSEPR